MDTRTTEDKEIIKKKGILDTKIISVALIISTILNIILNFFFIRYGLTLGMSQAVLGACIATVTSRYLYLGMLMAFKEKSKD